ncbi:recombinase family protein [Actinocrinis puniceicyclus]|uniref:Recombinase family protein n=1 Tax=Actinocrinis puniceicyclus TaxID=977794 RepID=A0A8J7WTG8_9ACTN|nr:recombinase family protein [Actinocrinis puniceicyclus]MBS2966455.1 recombinase family protein [Actinocrinis puniceicyclus]
MIALEVLVVIERTLAEALGQSEALMIDGIGRVIAQFEGRVQLAEPWDGQGPRPLTYDAYCRISKDERGQLEGVARQLRDILEHLVRHRLPLGLVWIDNSLSAWNLKAASRRVGWRSLMERIEAGVVDGVVIYYLDRMLRQPRDVEALIQAADRNDGLMVRGTNGSYDLCGAQGRAAAREAAAWACRESDIKSMRIRTRKENDRLAGQPGGWGMLFGFQRQRAPLTVISQYPDPAEAEWVREAFRCIAEGGTVADLVRAWDRAGLRTPHGAVWSFPTIRKLLTNTKYAGYWEWERERRDEHGRRQRESLRTELPRPAGLADEVVWPIVGPELFERVQAVVRGRRRGGSRPRSRVLSGLMVCGVCGRSMGSGGVSRHCRADGTMLASARYRCSGTADARGRCDQSVDAVRVEAIVFAAVRAWYQDPANAGRARTATQGTSAEVSALRGQIERYDHLLTDNDHLHADGDRPELLWQETRHRLVAARRRAREQLEELSAPVHLSARAAADAVARWDAAGFAERRAMIQEACALIEIRPKPPGLSNVFNPSRVHVKVSEPSAC